MAYPNYIRGYGYRDDEDEDEAYSSNAPMSAQLSALLPKPDPQMDERWRAAENQALDRATPHEYGVAEGVRDFAPMAVGSILDILVNKGKGLGAIAGAGMQALSAQDERRDKDRHEAANEALNIRRERGTGADRMTNAYHALLRGKELENRINEQAAKSGTPEEQAAARKAGLAHTEAETRKLTAEAENTGLRDIINLLSSQNQRDRDTGLQALKKRELDINERRVTAEEERNRLDREGKRATQKTSNKETFNRMGKDALAQARIIADLEPLIAKYKKSGKEKPGVGPADSRLPAWFAPLTGGNTADAIKFQQGTGRLFGWASHEVTGANSPEKERDYNLIAQGLKPGSTEQEFDIGIDTATKMLRSNLRGLSSADEEAAREVLRENGLEEWVYGTGAAPQAPGTKAPPQPPKPGAAAPSPTTGRLPPKAAPPDQPVPERAPPTPEQKKQMQALMNQIPKNDREVVLGGLGINPDMSYDEQLRLLSEEVARRVISKSGNAPVVPSSPAPTGFKGRRRRAP